MKSQYSKKGDAMRAKKEPTPNCPGAKKEPTPNCPDTCNENVTKM